MHDDATIEEQIRRRYRQPKGIEQFGVEPIPLEKKTVKAFDIFSIILGLCLSPGSIMVGGLAVVSGMSFVGAVTAITLGMLIAVIPYTYSNTNLSQRKPNDPVNLEADILGKYIEQHLAARKTETPVTEVETVPIAKSVNTAQSPSHITVAELEAQGF